MKITITPLSILLLFLGAGLSFLGGCDKAEEPPPQPQVIEQRIHLPQPAAETQAQPVETPAGAPDKVPEKTPIAEPPTPPDSARPSEQPVAETDILPPPAVVEAPEMHDNTGTVEAPAALILPETADLAELLDTQPDRGAAMPRYRAEGRVDPFAALVDQRVDGAETVSPHREKRTVLTPLEQIDLAQLKLTAIVQTTAGRQAMVEEVTGKGYVVRPGDYIGLKSGIIIAIEADRLVIEEIEEDLMGEAHSRLRELLLQRPPGG